MKNTDTSDTKDEGGKERNKYHREDNHSEENVDKKNDNLDETNVIFDAD